MTEKEISRAILWSEGKTEGQREISGGEGKPAAKAWSMPEGTGSQVKPSWPRAGAIA